MVTNGAAFTCCFRGPCNRTARLGAESDDTSAGSWAAEGGEPASPENRCAVTIPRHGQREGPPASPAAQVAKPHRCLSLQRELLLTALAVGFIDSVALFQILFIDFNMKKIIAV